MRQHGTSSSSLPHHFFSKFNDANYFKTVILLIKFLNITGGCMLAAMMSSVQSPWHERCNVDIFVCVINITFVMFFVRFCLNK